MLDMNIVDLYENVQAQGAADVALRHTLRWEETHLLRVRQRLLQEGSSP